MRGNNDQLVSINGKCLDQNFSFKISSKFIRYTKNSKIIHQCIKTCSGTLSGLEEEISIEKILKWFPLEITEVKLGFEIYKKSFFGSMLGSAPSVKSRFNLDFKNKKVKVEYEGENKFKSKLEAIMLN